MANEYFAPVDIAAGSRARSVEIDNNFNLVEDGFDALPSKTMVHQGTERYVALTSGSATAYDTGVGILTSPQWSDATLSDGLSIEIKIDVTNTGACTLKIGLLTAKDIKDPAGNDPAAGDLPAGSVVRLRYNGTHFRSVGPFPGAAAAPSTASQAQAEDGTDTTKLSFTPQRVHQAAKNAVPVPLLVVIGDETTALTSGTGKITFRMPFAMTLTEVRASLTTASDTGAVTIDINEGGTTILSTKLTIDQDEKTSTTAATPAVISDTTLADDAEMTVDIDGEGANAAGLKITLIGYKTTT